LASSFFCRTPHGTQLDVVLVCSLVFFPNWCVSFAIFKFVAVLSRTLFFSLVMEFWFPNTTDGSLFLPRSIFCPPLVLSFFGSGHATQTFYVVFFHIFPCEWLVSPPIFLMGLAPFFQAPVVSCLPPPSVCDVLLLLFLPLSSFSPSFFFMSAVPEF